MLEGTLVFLGGICIMAGIAGCFLPFLPGPPLSYLGLILLQASPRHPFTAGFLIFFAVAAVLAVLLDYVIPVYGTRRFQGTKYGVWGSAAGLLLGLFFFPPFGILVGPVLGAFAGELIHAHDPAKAVRSAFGSIVGFLAGALIKLILCTVMAYYFVISLL